MKQVALIVLGSIIVLILVFAVNKEKVVDNKPAESIKTDNTANLAYIAEQIRSGKIDVGKDYSTNFQTGRFHIIHADKLLMDCNNCHYGTEYKKDYQIMGKNKPLSDKEPGRLQRNVCLGCHGKGGIATQLYGSNAEW